MKKKVITLIDVERRLTKEFKDAYDARLAYNAFCKQYPRFRIDTPRGFAIDVETARLYIAYCIARRNWAKHAENLAAKMGVEYYPPGKHPNCIRSLRTSPENVARRKAREKAKAKKGKQECKSKTTR